MMNLSAWQTIWLCVSLAVLILIVDGFFAHRVGLNKTESARQAQRQRRAVNTKA